MLRKNKLQEEKKMNDIHRLGRYFFTKQKMVDEKITKQKMVDEKR